MAKRGTADLLATVLGPPHDSRTMAELVAHRLRALIVDGQLPPGTPLRLVQISKRLGVSSMPVRDALRLLEGDSLVEIVPRKGAIVSELSIEDAEETYAVRTAYEALAARHAARRLTDGDLGDIRAAFDRMVEAQRAGDLRSFIDADHVFHQRLYQASGRERLIDSISDLVDRSRRYSPYVYQTWLPLDHALSEHRPILAAIESRDADLLERLTYEHMSAAATRLVSVIGRDDAQVMAHQSGHKGAPSTSVGDRGVVRARADLPGDW